MANKAKDIYLRTRKPVIFLVCEGRNKTERSYFNHFIVRDANYTLKIFDSEATDIMSLGKRGHNLWQQHELDKALGDHVFCLFDIDLNKDKADLLKTAEKKFKNIEFIPSNPCFEAWLLFYFTDYPSKVSSSKDEKEQMKKYIPNYSETTDVLSLLNSPDHYTAIDRAHKCSEMQRDIMLADKNPYTEVPQIVLILLAHKAATHRLIESEQSVRNDIV